MRTALALVALAASSPAAAQFVSGPATVIDGDSLTVSGVEVRLWGVDAPEAKQTCDREGTAWPCGEVAAQQLRGLVGDNRVDCRGQGKDTYGRVLAVCSVRYDQLNKVMVEQGWATAFRKYTEAYVPEETRAKQARLGIWSSTFAQPEDFRAANQPTQLADAPDRPVLPGPRIQARTISAPSGCRIKGNHSRKGEWIYHMPGMPYYEQTRPEAMFCSEEEARRAGYRRSRAGRR